MIDSRQVVAKWADLDQSVRDELERKRRIEEKRAEITTRLARVLGMKEKDVPYFSVDLRNGKFEVRPHLHNHEFIKLLEAAERGLA